MTLTAPDPRQLPLSALLSQVLVAFTIEFDNEAERHIPHRTSDHGGTAGGVWLVSMAMWLNCMRYAGEEPITVAELGRLARTHTNVGGMRRWGYITAKASPADRRVNPPEADLLVRARSKGRAAAEIWEPLTTVIEERWRDRYGAGELALLQDRLRAVCSQLDGSLPDCLPILRYGLFSAPNALPDKRQRTAGSGDEVAQPAGAEAVRELPLPWLVAKALLALAIEFELEAKVSLAIAANVLRLVDEEGTRVKDLPVQSGVSPEGLAMATGYLHTRGLAVFEAGPPGQRWKVVRLTQAGRRTADACTKLLTAIEDRWHARYGTATITGLRAALEPLIGGSGDGKSPLSAAIEPYPDGWRASVRRPETLPHYPMVLHRGGYPDGS